MVSAKIDQLINSVSTTVIVLIIITIIFNINAEVIPEAQRAGNQINSSVGVLGSLFLGSSIIFLTVVVALFVMIIRMLLKDFK